MTTPLLNVDPAARPLKKIGIEMGSQTYLIMSAEEAAPIIAALTRARLYKKNGYSADSPYEPTNTSPDIILIPDNLIHRDLAGMVAAVTDPAAP